MLVHVLFRSLPDRLPGPTSANGVVGLLILYWVDILVLGGGGAVQFLLGVVVVLFAPGFVLTQIVGVNSDRTGVWIAAIGIVGAAIATGVAWFLNVALHVRYLHRLVPFDIPYQFVGWYVVASAVMSGVLVVATTVWPVTNIVVLLTHIAIGIGVYTATVSVIPNVRNEVILPGVRTILA